MYIAIAVASITLLAVYLIASIFIYKKKEETKFSFLNTFSYELWKSKDRNTFVINIILFFALGLFITNNMTYLLKNYDSNRLMSVILSVILAFSVGATNIIPLNKYKEHLTMSMIMMAATSLLSLMNLIAEIRLYRILTDNLLFISIVIDTIILLISLVGLLDPKLFNLNMQRDVDGKLIRPRFIHLATFEWLTILAFLFSQVSLIIFELI